MLLQYVPVATCAGAAAGPKHCSERGSCTAANQGLRLSKVQSPRTKALMPATLKSYSGPIATVHGGLVPGAYSVASCPEIASPSSARPGVGEFCEKRASV